MKAALQLSIIVLYIFPFNMCKATVTCSSLGGEAPVLVYNSPYTILENGSLCCDSYDGPTTCIEVGWSVPYCIVVFSFTYYGTSA